MAVDDQYTVSLLHFDGNFTDESGKIWTNGGSGSNTTVITPVKFGTGALSTLQTSNLQCTSSDFGFGTGDFCKEFWINIPNFSSVNRILNNGASNFVVQFTTATNFLFYDGTSHNITVSFPISNYFHVEFDRSNGTLYIFLNGQLIYTQAYIVDFGYSQQLNFNMKNSNDGSQAYWDEFRISKIARHTSSFTPSTHAYGTSAQQAQCSPGGM